ncbi:Uma2 family endonuclease [Nocardiopsis suaedae]|uniref:Uma2 family endonuclease n=1 Tax=Nocardiopsis suaedae TaxID=3018444 RepID=A0ABT4TJS8_9ACTN|nr:Uma2 family endonuclease [Nocardiopsis suaedae]MDA2804871.1 Uma2 family endonuclease [Nocardiopsis suaedae]
MSADLDRARATLRPLGDGVRGYKAEVVRGRIVLSPVRPFHKRTAFSLWGMLERRLGAERRCIGGVGISSVGGATELCPDVAVIPAAEQERNLETRPPGIVDPAIDVVSPGGAIRDHVDKGRTYAEAGVPV